MNPETLPVRDMDTMTVWSHKDEKVPCQYGTIRMEDWCHREAARLQRGNRRKFSVVYDGELVAIKETVAQ